MSRDDENAVLAFKNAWLGVLTSAAEIEKLSASVQGLPNDTDPASLDFETYHRLTEAHANAVMGLRGLIVELKRLAGAAD